MGKAEPHTNSDGGSKWMDPERMKATVEKKWNERDLWILIISGWAQTRCEQHSLI